VLPNQAVLQYDQAGQGDPTPQNRMQISGFWEGEDNGIGGSIQSRQFGPTVDYSFRMVLRMFLFPQLSIRFICYSIV
jgi:hypothetical protein